LDRPLVKVEAGQYGYQRGLVAVSPGVGDGYLLAALELVHKDGPWVHPDDYKKLNGVFRWSRGEALSGLSVTGMFYDADWSSTDQIPERAVGDGRLTRFDAVDPTDGGKARRASLSAEWQAYDGENATRFSGFLLRNELNLWSNFTYVLDDPKNGDQFEQEDRRWVLGFDGSRQWMHELAGRASELEFGGGMRHDSIGDVGLYATASRVRLSTTRRDEVGETSLFLYGQNVYQWTPHVRSTVGLRGDYYLFDVSSNLLENSGHRTAGLVSPKVGLVFGPFQRSELYVNAGLGFHSNDARGTTIRVDPKTGARVDPVDPLVRGWGAEVGVRTLALQNVHTTFAFWGLGLDSELLYVGDAGTTEASRPSERLGFEWSLDALPKRWLTLDVSWVYSRAHFTDDDPAGNRIPSSIEGVATAGVAVTGLRG
jgi:outer membrane receptor protein involved in Fe transport